MQNDFKPFRPRPGVRPQAKPTPTGEPPEPAFKTPDQAAAADIGSVAVPVKPAKKRSFWQRLRHWDLTRKDIIIISAVVGLIIAAFLIWWFAIRKEPVPPKPTPPPVAKEAPPPKPTTVPSRLTGVQVTPELDALPTEQVDQLTSQISLQFARDYCASQRDKVRENAICRPELLKLLAAKSLSTTTKEPQ